MTKHIERQDHEARFRAIEAEFHERPDHQPIDTAPALITMPTEIEFQQMATERENQELAERARQNEARISWERHERKQKWSARGKKALAASAILLTVKSGGLIDKVGDRFTDAGDVVAGAIEEPKVQLPDELDGIKFEDFSEDTQAEMIADEEESVERQGQARDTLIDLFSDLDSNGPDELLKDVEIYKVENAHLFVPEKVLSDANNQIEKSNSNEETLSILNDVMSNQFEIGAGFENGSAFEGREGTVKNIAKAYLEVFGSLPKDFVALAELETVQISNSPPVSGGESGPVVGNYSPDSDEIRMFARSPIFHATISAAEKLPYVSEDTFERVVAHELGHALDENLILPVTDTDVEASGMNAVGFVEFIGRELVQRPEYTTLYSASDEQEHSAEALSGILSNTSDGLADVDEWRRFGSESNKIMIRLLGQLEEVYPGIAKLLVANRLR